MDYVIQENTGMFNDEKRHFFPRAASTHQISTKELIQNATGLRQGEMEKVLPELRDQIIKYVKMGHTVKIDGLGVFSPALKFEDKGVNSTEMMSDEEVKKFYKNKSVVFDTVNFSIDAEWKREMRRSKPVSKQGFIFSNSDKGPIEDRIARTKAYLEEHGYITIGQYARLHGMANSSAQKEMQILKLNAEYGFGKGAGGHMVLVK